MITDKDILGDEDILLTKIGNELISQLNNKQIFGNLLDGINTHFSDIVEHKNYKDAFRQAVQYCMSWILEDSVENNGLNGESVFGKKEWNSGEAGCLIWELYDINKSYKVIDNVIKHIVDNYSGEILKHILTLKLNK